MTNRLTLALADDDELHLELLSSWLEHLGHRVLRFTSGDDLLAWASSAAETVDVFLLDIDMPGRNGFESCRALRAIPRYAGTPAVFVSSLVDGDDPDERALASGGTYALRKDGDLFERLGRWLNENLETAAA